MDAMRRVEWLMERAKSVASPHELDRLEFIRIYDGCVEPGYDDEVVVLGNWNDTNDSKKHVMSRLSDLIEKVDGARYEWDDEWIMCDCCYKVFRSSQDSYGWTMSGIIDDGSVVCRYCLKDDPESLEDVYRNSYINEAHRAWTFNPGFEETGWVVLDNEWETGLHPGQNDNPEDVLEKLEGIDCMFYISGCGQFDISWQVVVREEDVEAARKKLAA